MGEAIALVRRRSKLIGVCVALVVGAVVVEAYLSPKVWEATSVVHLDPVEVPGLHTAGSAVPSREDAIDGDVAVARGPLFRDGLTSNIPFEFDFNVRGDAERATVTFVAHADSAERAFDGAYSVANGFI